MKTMIMRALLLLLALMTGLSAAQADDAVRPVLGAPGVSAASGDAPAISAACAVEAAVILYRAHSRIVSVTPAQMQPLLRLSDDRPRFPCTHRADRARE